MARVQAKESDGGRIVGDATVVVKSLERRAVVAIAKRARQAATCEVKGDRREVVVRIVLENVEDGAIRVAISEIDGEVEILGVRNCDGRS